MDYFAAVFTALGVYLLGKKIIWGWVASFIGSALWITYATLTNQPPLIMLNALFIYLDVRGYWLWSKETDDAT